MQDQNHQVPTSFRSLKTLSRGEYGVPFKDAELLLVNVPLQPEEVRKILPWGLRPADPPRGTIVFAHYPKFPYGVPYHEAILLVHVRTLLGRGVHCPWIVVDDDAAQIAGREFLGYPKKIGRFAYSMDEGGLEASVTRRGVELIKVHAKRGDREANPAPVFAQKTFNLGGPGQLFAVSPLLLFKPRETIHESYSATVELEMKDSVLDPIAPMISGGPLSARMVRMDILDGGYFFMAGLTGGRKWCLNTFNMRFR
ncbi:MAG: acetoacetate decarboxylase family protein [Pseudomonadota bacterium]